MLRLLSKYMEVDVYGKCGTLTCEKGMVENEEGWKWSSRLKDMI